MSQPGRIPGTRSCGGRSSRRASPAGTAATRCRRCATPRPAPREFRLAQRGDALEVSRRRRRSPRSTASPTRRLVVEILYAEGQKDLEKAGHRREVPAVRPAAASCETLPLPAPGTIAPRGRAGHRGPREGPANADHVARRPGAARARPASSAPRSPRTASRSRGTGSGRRRWPRPRRAAPGARGSRAGRSLRAPDPRHPPGRPAAAVPPGPVPPAPASPPAAGATAGSDARRRGRARRRARGATASSCTAASGARPSASRSSASRSRSAASSTPAPPWARPPATWSARWPRPTRSSRARRRTRPASTCATSSRPRRPREWPCCPARAASRSSGAPSADADLAGYRVYRTAAGGPRERLAEVGTNRSAWLDDDGAAGRRLRLHGGRLRPGRQRERRRAEPVEASLP